MVFLTLTIGVVNLCLGYAVAVYLGYGPSGPSEAEDAPARGGDAAEEAIEGGTRELDLTSASVDQMLDDEPHEETDPQPDVETYDDSDDDEAESADPGSPEDWELDEKYVETSLLKLNVAMMRSGKRATDIDTQLRTCRGNTDQETIQRCLAELKEDCETYLAEQAETAERFSARVGELGTLSALGEEIEMANLEQAAQIETTLSNLGHMDFESDLEAANSRLLTEIAKLRVARHKLRDSQDVAFLAIARYENRLDTIDSRLCNDQLTRLNNRIGLETTLWQWGEEGRQQSHRMSAALFDLDRFDKLNEEHGPLIGDRILYRIAQFIQGQFGKEDLVGRYAGQQFLAIMLDLGPRAATKNAEQIRQSIENMTFVAGDREIRLTTAGGLTEVLPEDTHEALFQRLEAALKRAKEAGGNRSSFRDGEETELIESPNLGTKPLAVQI